MLSWSHVEREQTVLKIQYVHEVHVLLHVQMYGINIHYYNSSQHLHRACYMPGTVLSSFNTLTHLTLSNKPLR